MRVAIPLVKRIRAANNVDELRIVSLTGMIGADDESTPGKKARELEIDHAVALTEMFGRDTPYLNMNHMPGLTYAYIVGRAGGVVWRGDPSRKTDEFLEALGNQLAAPRVRPLSAPTAEELADAVAAYVAGDFARARKLAEKVGSRFGKKKGAEAAAVATQAAALVEAVDGTQEDLRAALAAAFEARDAEAICRAAHGLQTAFPKTDAASTIDDQLSADAELSASVQAWSAWLDLERARPPAFPERPKKAGKAEKRYARNLEKYLKKNARGPGRETARAWLQRYSVDG